MEPGLSSPATFRSLPERPSGQLTPWRWHRGGVRSSSGRERVKEPVEGGDGGRIGDSVDQTRPEVTLKGADDYRELLVIFRRVANAVAEFPESVSEACDSFATVADLQAMPCDGLERCHPQADARFVQSLPRKELTGVFLPCRRHIGMGEDALSRDGVPAEDAGASAARALSREFQ